MENNDNKAAMAKQLMQAIERLRADIAIVELWANAVTGFAEPVPDYDPSDISVWLPHEQATLLDVSLRPVPATPKPASASERKARPSSPCPESGSVTPGRRA